MKAYRGIDYTDIYKNLNNNRNDNHSMGSSLNQYINIKLPMFIFDDNINEIYIIGKYDRNCIISNKEKTDKVFNYERPTYKIDDNKAYIFCYPGVDYVYHYYCMVNSYLKILNKVKMVIPVYPTEEQIRNEIGTSNLNMILSVETVIMGYVAGFDYLSNDSNWIGDKDFMWKRIGNDKLLLGCKHSYWGDIIYYVVEYLANKGVKNVIYSGKLGTLNKEYVPNETIATGNKSIFRDGTIITWNNMFSCKSEENIKDGVHATLPSIFDETNGWVNENKDKVDFVDPEIGFVAKSANDNNINFSYMHIISDNLSKKFNEDLSNERKADVLCKRKKLIKQIGNNIMSI